jgi:peptidoglycan-associated lipoprotein
MNKQFLFVLAVLALVPGCWQRKSEKRQISKNDVLMDVDIPVAQNSVQSFFDEDLGEMALADAVALENDDTQYAWIDESGKNNGFKKVYFDFDKYNIKATEKEAVAQDVARMQEFLAQEQKDGKLVQFVINGNADHAAGSDVYNRCLSERRAKTLKDCAVAAGIPAQKIKIVGRGSDMPELVNGKPCTGDKDQQWPNRRDEIQVIPAVAAA